ncbi:MAG: HAD family phosphatase [Elusimicrobiota bacterium]|jgi:2-haloacid dehalogenase|nr:HAD family phosphatase [Elusimicrobiota bacterium]
MSIKNVVFDVGGVFAVWEPRAVFKRYFENEEQVEAFMKEIDFYGMNEKGDLGNSVSELVKETAIKFPQYKEPILAYDRDWLDCITQFFEDTRSLAISLKSSGYKIYVLSNWESDKFKLFDSKYKLLEIFDGFLLSGDVHLIKPYPEIYNLFLSKFDLKAQECAFLDDRQENVIGAKNVGFEAFLFTNAKQAQADLESIGVKIKK